MFSINSLKFRTIAIFAIVITPLIFVLYFNNYFAMQTVREQVSQSYKTLLPLYVQKMDESLDEISNYNIGMLGESPEALALGSYIDDKIEYPLVIQSLNKKLLDDITLYSSLDGIFVLAEKNSQLVAVLSSEMDTAEIRDEILNLITSRIKGSSNYITHWEPYKLNNSYKLVRIFSRNNGIITGAIVNLDSMLRTKTIDGMGKYSGTAVISDKGIILSSTKQLPLGAIGNNFVITPGMVENGTENIYLDGKKYILILSDSKRSNVTYVAAFEERVLLKDLQYFLRMTYFIPLFILIILFLFFVSQRGFLFNPLGDMVMGMKKVMRGNFDVTVKETGADEIKFLIANFNKMIYEIKNLKISVYEEQLRYQQIELKKNKAELDVKKAELKYLQVQINPHFYANSLFIIYNLAAIKDYSTIQKMVIHLSNYFRFILRTNQALLDFKEEIDHVKNYLDIQKLRFTSKMEYEILKDDGIDKIKIPPLTIQPFVENSILHGFTEKDEPLLIKVCVKLVESKDIQYINVIISDNGNGFSETGLAKFNDESYIMTAKDQHIGIWNVFCRLRLQYGEAVQIKFRNNDSGGAEVELFIPLGDETDLGGQADVQLTGS